MERRIGSVPLVNHVTWRQRLAATIQATLAANKGKSQAALMAALRKACPFTGMGDRPNAVWRQEVQYALGVVPRPRHRRDSATQ